MSGKNEKNEKNDKARSERIGIRATPRMVGQLAEVCRVLSTKTGSPVSQSQAIAYALNFTLETWAANPKQYRLI